MRLTQKLIGYLNRVFDKSARPVLALRISHVAGGLTWTIQDGVLTLVVGDSGFILSDTLSSSSASVGETFDLGFTQVSSDTVSGWAGGTIVLDLSLYTVRSLAAYIETLDGFSVEYLDDTGEVADLSARVLLDGSGRQADSNGDHLYAYTSLLWVYLEPIAAELKQAANQIDILAHQMVVQTAEGQWLDELGGYYSCDRDDGEQDQAYALRIIASIGKPAGNNVAIEAAINTITGGLRAQVIDAAAQAFTSPYAGTSYGLFDVVYDIDLEGTDDINAYTSRVTAIVEALRDAGTHMKSILISGRLDDSYNTLARASDALSAISVGIGFEDSAALVQRMHNGAYLRDGSIAYNSGAESLTLTLTVSGVPQSPEPI